MQLRSLIFAAILSVSAHAQEQVPQPGARLEQLQQRLNLTEDQRAKIRPILVEEFMKVQAIRANYDGQTSRRSRLKMLRELRDVQQNLDKRVTPILTNEQRAEWKRIREERKEELREQRR